LKKTEILFARIRSLLIRSCLRVWDRIHDVSHLALPDGR
jgi:hypothetical protein